MPQFGQPGYANTIFPQSLVGQYSGLGSFRNALNAFGDLAYGPESRGYQQLTESAAADPTAMEYQDSSQLTGGAGAGGRGENAALGLFGALQSGLGAANVAGLHARDVGKAAALKGVGDVGIGAADAEAAQQRGQLALENAQTQADAQTVGGLSDILKLATSPGAMKLFGGLSSLFAGPTSLLDTGLLGAGGGAAASTFAGSGGIGAAEALGGLLPSAGAAGAAGGFGEMMASLADFAPALFAA